MDVVTLSICLYILYSIACRALLQRMAPEHKFATAAKLCGEVLGGVADGLLPLEQCEEVLGDALRCLASKDIKVTASGGQQGPLAYPS